MSASLMGQAGAADGGNQGAGAGGNSNAGGQAPGANGGTAGGAAGGANGGSTPSWRDSLPAELKDNPILSKYSDVPNLAKAYIHAQEAISKKGVIVPDWTKSTPEQVKAFKEAIGVPPEDKYEVGQPQGFEFPKETMDWFKKTAAKVGVLPQDANALLAEYAAFETGRNAALEKQKAESVKTAVEGLKKEWGDAFDTNLRKALFAAKELGGDDFVKHVDQNGMGNDPHFIKVMTKVAELLGEDKLAEGGVANGKMSPAEIDKRIGQIYGAGNTNGLYDKNHPSHKAVTDELQSLFKMKTGGR